MELGLGILHKTDVAIIGAGPVGLFAVFQAGMLGMKCIVMDALDFIGGQCSALYPEKPIYDIPAYKSIDAQVLIENLKEQAAQFNPKYILGDGVAKVTKKDAAWILETIKGEVIEAKVIIISAGAGAFGPNKPPLENLHEFEGKSVFYHVSDRKKFANQTLIIAGGGDSAVDWANSLSSIAKKIYVVHRRDKFRAMQSSIDKMYEIEKSGKIEFVIPYQIDSIEGDAGKIYKANFSNLDGDIRSIECDSVLMFYGLKMELGDIVNWNLNLEKNHIISDPSSMSTNQEGIYAIGDIATYNGKLKLILCGFSEAAMACHHAYNIVFPGKALHFEYSTTKGVK